MYNYKAEEERTDRICSAEGCMEPALYKAPKHKGSRGNNPDDYIWFCLEHVREYNKKWDYFSGMSQEEIESFQKDAASTGHRPTWSFHIPPHMAEEMIRKRAEEILGLLGGRGAKDKGRKRKPTIAEKDRVALDAIGLIHPASVENIKKQYKKLVKIYHPDINKDDDEAEEKFKNITASYNYLMNDYVKSQRNN